MNTITLKQLSKDIQDFVAFKRGLGFKYQRNEFILRSFERYAKITEASTELLRS